MSANTMVFSVSRSRVLGPNPTPTVSFAAGKNTVKLSNSLFNNPLWVNNPVQFESRKQTFLTAAGIIARWP